MASQLSSGDLISDRYASALYDLASEKKLVQNSFSYKNIIILGPVEAPIFLLRGQHRYRILIKGSSRKLLNEYTKFLLKKYPLPPSLKRIVDVDPYTFM